ncbi:MAG: energy-coupling factor transporter transmembrane protein EcfT, partial [Clostridia bacterium]|nr:energy-coupling factor transporter transmembrane protein EcfT [Clostridia bacterium]
MISDITLGQFFPGFSPIHKLDPRTKLITAFLYIVTVFFANNPTGFLFLLLFTLSLVKISSISFRVVFKGLKPIIFVLIFTALLNMFLTTGS